MSACKSPKCKSELNAIYRLEFYKKQKSWKLSSRLGKNSSNSKKPVDMKYDLNTTYNIEGGSETRESCDRLNVAFVDYESDEIETQNVASKLSSTKKNELSQQWLQPVNIWPDVVNSNIIKENKNIPSTENNNVWLRHVRAKSDGYAESPDRHSVMMRLQLLQKAAQLQEHKEEDQDNVQNLLKESMIHPHSKQNIVNAWDYNSADCHSNDDYFCGEDKWQMQAEVLLGTEHMAQDIQPAEEDIGEHSEDIIYSADWLPKPVSHFENSPFVTTATADSEHWCDLTVDSIGEFMRGADAAPHSSEMDLALPLEMEVADVSFTTLSRLSTEQLAQAARRHSQALRRLLLESEHRQTLRRALSFPSEYSSIEEYPTRDVGLESHDVLLRNVHPDAFVAGSHLHPQAGLDASFLRTTGRGRGRLV